MKTTNPFIAEVAGQPGEMTEPTPQDSQTLTADDGLRKSALDFVDWIIWHKSGILNGMTNREVNDFTEELGKFRAALNQGQG